MIMLSGDEVFPLPEPTFLFVHSFTVHNVSASPLTSADGKFTYQTTNASSIGYITAPDPETTERAATRGVRLNAVVLFPRATQVFDSSEITTLSSNVPGYLQGRYFVESVRDTLVHRRVLLMRTKGTPSNAP